MSISSSQQKAIQDFCLSEQKTVPQIAAKLLLKGKNAIIQLYHFLQTKAAKTLFYIEKSEGFVWVRTNPLFFSNSSLDLIRSKQSEPKTETQSEQAYKKIKIPNRTGPERFKAIQLLNRLKYFGYYNRDTKEFEYTCTGRQELDTLFSDYCTRTLKEKIVMTRAPDNNPVFSKDTYLQYATRFTSPHRRKQNLDSFRRTYNKARKRHLKGVFLTLTSNPRGGNSLWEINNNTRNAWGKMHKFLNRALPPHAEWIKVSEFQKNGMLHYHVLILGVNWLLKKSVIQYAWVHFGGGYIMDIHTIKNDPIRGWVWARSCPLDAAGKQVEDYLEGYLEKGMSMETGAMYWAAGIQTWTCSDTLKEKTLKNKPLKSPKKRYFLKGVLSALTGFRSSHRKDSLSLFAVNTAQEKPSKPKKEKPSKPEKLDLSFTTASKITQSYLKASRGL